jgi:hypothetical protein
VIRTPSNRKSEGFVQLGHVTADEWAFYQVTKPFIGYVGSLHRQCGTVTSTQNLFLTVFGTFPYLTSSLERVSNWSNGTDGVLANLHHTFF